LIQLASATRSMRAACASAHVWALHGAQGLSSLRWDEQRGGTPAERQSRPASTRSANALHRPVPSASVSAEGRGPGAAAGSHAVTSTPYRDGDCELYTTAGRITILRYKLIVHSRCNRWGYSLYVRYSCTRYIRLPYVRSAIQLCTLAARPVSCRVRFIQSYDIQPRYGV
jgi:hypothetical protein